MRFLFIVLLPCVLLGYEWATPQLIGSGSCGYSRFALDCYDSLWCIFNVYGPDDTIKASCYDGLQWLEPVPIFAGSQASGVGGFDATTAKDGKLWVITSNEVGGSSPHIAFYYDGNVWSDTFVIIGATGFHLAADSIGKVWATLDGFEDYRIWCDICEDTLWTGPYVVCSYPNPPFVQVAHSCITVAPNGIRWVGGLALLWPNDQIFLTFSDSTGAWTNELIRAPQIDSGCKMLRDITTDNDGNIWIAWCNSDEDRIYTAYLDTNLNWSPYYLITQSSGEFLGCGNMTVDAENKVWIVYDKDSTFYYRVWDGVQWSIEDTIVTSPASFANHGDIFYDAVSDRIWVSFRYGTGFSGDIYTTWTTPSSNVEEKREHEQTSKIPYLSTLVGDNLLIRYSIHRKTTVTINLYDNTGRLITRINEGEREQGYYYREIDASRYPSGVYHLIINMAETPAKHKFIIVR